MPERKDETCRTHEPSLRELTAELDGMRELFTEKFASLKNLMDERDKWYAEKDKDRQAQVDKALIAMDKQTGASFAASEKAIVKAEGAQTAYNQTHNDLARKMDEQNKATMPRPEIETRFQSQEERLNSYKDSTAKDISGLRESRDRGEGKGQGVSSLLGWIVAAASLAAAVYMAAKTH